MKCDQCDQPATIHLTELNNGKLRSLNLCEQCAKQHNGFNKSINTVGLADLLSGISKSSTTPSSKRNQPFVKQCENCGLQFEELQQEGKFGCAECYPTFQRALGDMLRGIHGTVKHAGKKPILEIPVSPKIQSINTVTQLKAELDHAINSEDFETAIQLRDRIRELEGESSWISMIYYIVPVNG